LAHKFTDFFFFFLFSEESKSVQVDLREEVDRDFLKATEDSSSSSEYLSSISSPPPQKRSPILSSNSEGSSPESSSPPEMPLPVWNYVHNKKCSPFSKRTSTEVEVARSWSQKHYVYASSSESSSSGSNSIGSSSSRSYRSRESRSPTPPSIDPHIKTFVRYLSQGYGPPKQAKKNPQSKSNSQEAKKNTQSKSNLNLGPTKSKGKKRNMNFEDQAISSRLVICKTLILILTFNFITISSYSALPKHVRRAEETGLWAGCF